MSVFNDTWKLDIDTAFERQIAKSVKQVSKLDDAFDDVEKEAKQADKAIRKVAKSTEKAGNASANATKAIEGVAQSMGISALSGERLANVWLAAGAAVGAVIAGVGVLVSKSLTAYIAKNKEAKDATERFAKAQDRLLVSLGSAIFAGEKGANTIDAFASKLDGFTAAIKRNAKPIRGFVEGTVDATNALVKFFTSGLQIVTFPILGFIDLVKQAGGSIIDFALGTIEGLAQIMNAVGVLPDSITKDVLGITDGVQKNVRDMTDISKGLVSSLDKSMTSARKFGDEMTTAAKGNDKFTSSMVKADKALQEFVGPVKTWGDEVKTAGVKVDRAAIAARELAAALNFEPGIASAKKFVKLLDDIEAGLTKVSGEQSGFGGGLTENLAGGGFAALAQDQTAQQGFAGAITEKVDPAAAQGIQVLDDLNVAFDDFANGGIMSAVDSFGLFAESMAAGTFNAGDFGKATLASLGDLLTQLGKGAIAAGLIGDWFQKGGLISNPGLGIGLGVAAFALGKVLSGGLAASGSRASSSGSGQRAASVARQSARDRNQDRNAADDQTGGDLVVVLDGNIVGRTVRKRDAQASRRGEFVASTTLRGLA